MANIIDTDAVSEGYRAKLIDRHQLQVLLSRLDDSEQANDLSEPTNCHGFGRIHHFHRQVNVGWPTNSLPIDPACKSLGLSTSATLRAQVFQLAACNWRCWYCYVPFNLLAASAKYSAWFSPQQMIDGYMALKDPPPIIDLSGGQPDLAPEWVPWMMGELRHRGLDNQVYLWSDDNLSNDYFWRYLSDTERELIATYPNYGRVCCFKGFSPAAFSFNTRAAPELFERQFTLMERLLTTGIDLYCYITLTAPPSENIVEAISRFIDRLQSLDEYLPLRTIPLQIQIFTPVRRRLNEETKASIRVQQYAIEAWQTEIERRFSISMRTCSIADVPLHGRKGR